MAGSNNRAQDRLKQQQKNFKAIFDAAPVGMLLIDENGVVKHINDIAARLTGRDASRIIGVQPGQALGCVYSHDGPGGCGHSPACSSCLIRNTFTEVFNSGQAVHGVEVRPALVVRGNQERPWLEISAEPVLMDDKRHVVLAVRNITDRRQAEEALRQSNEKYKMIFENSAVAITMADDQERLISWNRFTEDLLGMNKEDLYLRPIKSLYPAKEWEKIRAENVRRKGMQHHLETRMVKKTGEVIEIDVSLSVLKNSDDEVICSVGVVRDITDRKRAQESLQKAHDFQQQLISTAATAIFTLDADRWITDVNNEVCRLTGFNREELIGQRCAILQGDPCRNGCGLFDPSRTESILRKRCSIRSKDGRRLAILKNADVIRDESGNVTGGIESFVDVTELEEAREAAERANAAKSEFLANMSHELRTPLHGILSFSGFGINKYATAKPEKLLDYFEKIHQSGKVLLELLNDLLDLAKLEAGRMIFEFEPADLGMLIAQVADEFSSLVSERGLTICFDRPHPEAAVAVDVAKTKQLLRNLLSNAVKFSPQGGVIGIRMEQEDKLLVVSIQDQGPGIPENELEQVFDKFVQSSKTKSGAGGTGLGLAICREIMNAHKGRIRAENSADGGAVFVFEIPITSQTNAGRTPATAQAARD